MSKEASVIALGVVVIVTTQLGIPSSWRVAIIILCGVGLVAVGFFLRAEALARSSKRTPDHHFVENGARPDDPIGRASLTHDTAHEQKSGITSLN